MSNPSRNTSRQSALSSRGLRRKFRKLQRRAGLATMEVVLATGIMLPFAIALFFVGRKACGRFYEIVESLVTWPYL